MVIAHKTVWSATDRSRNVELADYFRLLDLLVGKRPATEAELNNWKAEAKSRKRAAKPGFEGEKSNSAPR